jgi:hypothetical protein
MKDAETITPASRRRDGPYGDGDGENRHPIAMFACHGPEQGVVVVNFYYEAFSLNQ